MADAKELQPEPLRSKGKNPFELVQGVNLEKTDGPGRGQVLAGAREVEVALLPRLWLGVARLARALRDQPRHIRPVGRGRSRLGLALTPARLRIGAEPEGGDQSIGVGFEGVSDRDTPGGRAFTGALSRRSSE